MSYSYDAFAYDVAIGEVFLLRIDHGDWNILVLEPVDHYLGYVSDEPFP